MGLCRSVSASIECHAVDFVSVARLIKLGEKLDVSKSSIKYMNRFMLTLLKDYWRSI